MSPRAAWRLEALGYSQVFDYAPGMADWLAAGLATERAHPPPPRVADFMDRAVPTCAPSEAVDEVAARLDLSGSSVCVVVNAQHVVQGRLRRDRIDATSTQPVDEVMEPGPATVRADAPLGDTLERMKKRNVQSLIVSTPDGVLLGLVVNEGEKG